jgi:hypothetical protein
MNHLKVSRLVATGIAIFAILAALVGALLGAVMHHGGYIAMSCLMAGIALSCLLWRRESFIRSVPS